MKNVFTMKNILAAILAGFGVMFIMITTPKGTEPLSADGDYTYPEYCIGHESDFVVDKSANSYINHGNVSDAITYVGTNGDFSCGEISLSAAVFDKENNSMYNESLDFGFKAPDGWEFVCPTPTADDEGVYFYDYGAVSPDGKSVMVVKIHDLAADGLKIKKYIDYWDIKTEKHWQDGYKDIAYTNIFAGDKYCDLAICIKDAESPKVLIASQILNDKYILVMEYTTPYTNTAYEVWQNFYSEK